MVKCYANMLGCKLWICNDGGLNTTCNEEEASEFNSVEECKKFIKGTELKIDGFEAVEFTKTEKATFRRLLRKELHEDLQLEYNKDLMASVAWREEHQRLVDYKFNLLKKLGSTEKLSEIKTYL